jgi:branched-subunit amino acid aminotransferase/4-amino-4-deoxychorismate lyase
MAERVAYVNGRVVPESAATVTIYDRGFLSGHGVFERTRTFRGELFRLDAHLARLYRGLAPGRLRDFLASFWQVGRNITLQNRVDRALPDESAMGQTWRNY